MWGRAVETRVSEREISSIFLSFICVGFEIQKRTGGLGEAEEGREEEAWHSLFL